MCLYGASFEYYEFFQKIYRGDLWGARKEQNFGVFPVFGHLTALEAPWRIFTKMKKYEVFGAQFF